MNSPLKCLLKNLSLGKYCRTGGDIHDNPTIDSSLVRYDSYCSHKPHGTSKPPF